MPELPEALRPLAQYPQFVVWRAEWDESRQKYSKKPINPASGHPVNPHGPTNWLPPGVAIETAQQLGDGHGCGFVFTENDPFWFLDIDNCVESGAWSPLATRLMAEFSGAAVEVSMSGQGLHIFGTGSLPAHRCRNDALGLELYHAERFVALTGNQASGCASTDHSGALARIIPEFFPEPIRGELADWTDEPCAGWSGPDDDDALIKKMLASRGSAAAVFGGGATVRDLWTCDEDKLASAYPDGFRARAFDHSSADAALCQHLAFWTGKNCERMERLFRQSELYREKWEREDYREATVLGAAGRCSSVYVQPKKKPPPSYTAADSVAPAPSTVSARAVHREGLQYMAPANQEELFAGCVYVRDVHRVFTPDGAQLKPDQFRATYGGYIFALDSTNDKTTKNAWEVFTESQAIRFPRVHSTCFRPELPSGEIIEEAGAVLLNTYVPIDVPSAPGDATPFTTHLANILPDEQDRAILTAYLAALVQHKGVKFQWAPLIQGIEGNGKTLLIKCVEAAIGQKYTHMPNASDLGGNGAKFNSWIQNKLFIGVEEVYVSDRREVSDALKPLITNDRIEIQGKGADQVTGDNRANFIMCSNHKDAILKNRGDRRYAVFFTAQQTPEDMHRVGMTQADGVTPTRYFADLFGWLKNRGGFAIVTHYLQNYEIPAQLNPADLCSRAPVTSSTAEAVLVSMGGVEQEIVEKIEQNAPGFAGGWVSSLALDRLLKDRRDDKRITHYKRRDLLEGMGYVTHPGLPDGRAGRVVPFDLGKPRLYVKPGSIQSGITGAATVVDAYVKAQGTAAVPGSEVFDKQESEL